MARSFRQRETVRGVLEVAEATISMTSRFHVPVLLTTSLQTALPAPVPRTRPCVWSRAIRTNPI